MSIYKIEKDGAKKTIYAYLNQVSKVLHTFKADLDKPYLILDSPLKLKERKYNVDPNLEPEVLEFVNKMEQKYSVSNLKIMYHNLRDVKVYHKISLLNPYYFIAGGVYNPFSNKISLSSKIEIESLRKHALYHELLHLASTNVYSNQFFSGFKRFSKNPIGGYSIGTGLTEGYTEYLVHDIFGTTNINQTYYCLKECMNILVKIVGREKMDLYYFTNNLKALRDDLAKYSSKEEANAFILDLDRIKTNSVKVTDYLDRVYRTKLKQELDDDLIDSNYALDEINYVYEKAKKINTLAKIKKSDEYLENIKQYHPLEYEDVQYIKEKKKEKREKIFNIW